MHVQTFTHACTHLHALQQSQRLLKIYFSPLTPHLGCQDNFKDTPLQLLFISLIPSPPFIPSFPQPQISLTCIPVSKKAHWFIKSDFNGIQTMACHWFPIWGE